ncbi:uncharacterized protein LOC112488294 isoform X1 [Cynoglossus semilaevis]|uniref:uncharacterized protein LOC112488294 isoform X1 n=1 Tax=Cynoglossus semilaevis TaxID=244447 RepID=UPI000D62C51A|nr:uncharacterized protein LOC112488294 isoform X1 [Cynoglossus semilaevis]
MCVINTTQAIQLLYICHVIAGKNNDVVVSKGDSVTFICNRTAETPSQINWRTSRCFFSYLKRNNNFTTNCTSDRVNITSNSPSELNILNVQYEDTGNYQCEIVSIEGVQRSEWNLLLKHEEWPSFIYPVTTVLVVFLLSTVVAICLYRRHKSRISNQHQPSLQSGSQAAPPHTQTETDRGGNVQRRSQYFERLNSIYGHY